MSFEQSSKTINNDSTKRNQIANAANLYAQKKMKVLPLYIVNLNKCSCSKGESCTSPGKHPATKNGLKDASNLIEQVEEWFNSKLYNIGLLTGPENGFFVLDIDKKNDGLQSFEEMENTNGKLPETYRVKTGGGGFHLYFKYPPNLTIHNKQEILKGIDIRGDGGYVVAPPSMHKSGALYEASPDLDFSIKNFSEAPRWLIELITKEKTHDRKERTISSKSHYIALEESEVITKIVELTNATQSGGFGSFVGHCPIHDDRNKSLSINKTIDGKILVKCHAGCEQNDLIDFFKRNNVWRRQENNQRHRKNDLVEDIWGSSHEINESDLASKYLRNRGINLKQYPKALRFNPRCYLSESPLKEMPALVAKIVNDMNEIIGVQRMYLNEEGRKANVECPKKILGNYSTGYVYFEGDSEEKEIIHFVEGVETGLAIFAVFQENTLCALSASNLSKVLTDKTPKTIHIWADKDRSETGKIEAEKAAKEFSQRGIEVHLHLPMCSIPEGAKGVDFLDVYVKDPNDIKNEINLGKIFTNKILPIKKPSYNLPNVMDNYLPVSVRGWVFNQAVRLNVAPELIVVPLFSIIGSLIGTKLAIQPKKNDYWTVYANMWGMIIAPPGTKKSAILTTSIKSLTKFEAEEAKEHFKYMEINEPLIEELQIKLEENKGKIKKAVKNSAEPEELKLLRNETSLLNIELKKLIKGVKRLSTNSFTIEKLIDMLGDNPNGLMIWRDEISGLFESFKKKGQESLRQFLLEGWNGDGTYQYDILSRNTKPLSGICITLLGGIQPSVINKMLSEMKQDQNDDGFIQRFQLTVYPNQDRPAKFVDSGIDKDLEKVVEELMFEIYKMDGVRFGIKTPYSDTCYTKLSPDAYARFAAYMDSNEKEVDHAENGGYKNHLSKFGKLFSGLILIFHVIDCIETKRASTKVQLFIVEMAILWCELFKAHAKKLYDIEYNFEALSGFALAKKIVDQKIQDGASIRTVYKNGWTNLKSQTEAELGAQFLEKHNWLKVVEEKPKSGRPSQVLMLNSKLTDFLKSGSWHEG